MSTDDLDEFPLIMQAKKIAENATIYKGSAPCPACGVIMNPVEFMQNRGMCLECVTQKRTRRAKNRMA